MLQEPEARSSIHQACEALGDNMEAIGVVSPAHADEVSWRARARKCPTLLHRWRCAPCRTRCAIVGSPVSTDYTR